MKKLMSCLIMIITVLILAFATMACGGPNAEPCEHDWLAGEITKEATCTTKGEITSHCAYCDETKIEEIDAMHSPDSSNICLECDTDCTTNGLKYEAINGGEAYTVAGIGAATGSQICIAKEYEGKPVIEIKERAFQGIVNIIAVNVPESVKTIGSNAFRGCVQLQEVTIADSVQEIKDNAFAYCGITKIKIPLAMKRIEKETFYWCTQLEEVFLPNGLVYIGSKAFYNCGIKKIEIPETVTHIDWSFENCAKLSEVALPDSLKFITGRAFAYCDSITEIVIPESVEEIDEYVFSNCANIIFYCKAESKPEGWSERWNSLNRPVYWKNEWKLVDEKPTPNN